MSTKTIMNAKQTTGAGTGYPLNNIYTKENKTFQISVFTNKATNCQYNQTKVNNETARAKCS